MEKGVVGDAARAVEFLCWLRPEGPWVLTAIHPSKDRPTRTVTFGAGKEAAVLRWLGEVNGTWNCYYMLNPPRGPLDSKAKKEDVESLDWLHVDVDPNRGEEPEAAKARILPLLEAFDPPPSAIVDSGNGLQALWRLSEPVYVGGDRGRAEELEAYNVQLEVRLGGDHCFNLDRILRLPGTVNVPDAKKRSSGRVARLASVVRQDDNVYPLSAFTSAPRVQSDGPSVGSSRVVLSGNLKTVDVNTDLPETVPNRIRMLIVQGDDPDEPTKYGSRSEVVFAVCCALIRAGCDDDTMASILLDKDYGVSGHILSQKRPADYAARQIQRARESVEEPMLMRMNEQHAVIADLGGKCRVISEVMDHGLGRPRWRISKQSFDDFRNRYMHLKVQVGTTDKGAAIMKPAGAWWLGHSLRRQYTSLVFAPGREPPDAYNLWRGFSCEAIPGHNHEPYLDHLLNNVCAGNADHYAYLIRWMARVVQRPGEAGEVAVVMRSGEGTGKGTTATLFGSLFGRHFLHVSSAKHLVGQFNAHLRDCVVLFADEAFFAGDKQHESVLKALVTEETLVVEGKGVDAEVGPNYTHILMSSNAAWVIPAGADSRRFFVLEVGEANKQDAAYFAELRRAMDAGGRESLLHFLLTLDLTGFNVRKVPQTEALRDQKMYSLGLEESWWLERLMDGRSTAASRAWDETITKDRIQADYIRYAEGQRINRRVSPTALGRFLSRVLPEGWPKSVQRTVEVERQDERGQSYTVKERVYHYDLPTLEAARAQWDARYGGPFGWPVEEAEPRATRGGRDDDPY